MKVVRFVRKKGLIYPFCKKCGPKNRRCGVDGAGVCKKGVNVDARKLACQRDGSRLCEANKMPPGFCHGCG